MFATWKRVGVWAISLADGNCRSVMSRYPMIGAMTSVTMMWRLRSPKRLRSKIASNRSDEDILGSVCFGHLSRLSLWILLYLHVESRQDLSAIVSINAVYVDPFLRNRFGDHTVPVSGSFLSFAPFSLYLDYRKMETPRNESLNGFLT